MNLIKLFLNRLKCKKNPVKYFRKIGVKIGKNVHFYGANPTMFSSEPWLVTLGDNVHISDNVLFLTHDNGTLLFPEKRFVICGNIKVGNNVAIGTRTIVMPGTTIGNNIIIGCGSIVTKDIPDNSVVAGVPAKVISTIDKYEEKIDNIIQGLNKRYYSSLEEMYKVKEEK